MSSPLPVSRRRPTLAVRARQSPDWPLTSRFACRWATLAVLFFCCPACVSPHHDDSRREPAAFTDPDSGIAFPSHIESFERTSLNKEASDKNPVSARYTATDGGAPIDTEIRLIPASSTSPDQLLSQTIRSVESLRNFSLENYPGQKTFGTSVADCAQCSFNRPGSSERAIFKVTIIPRANYLICVTFLVSASLDPRIQSSLDTFIRTLLATPAKPAYMLPENTGTDE